MSISFLKPNRGAQGTRVYIMIERSSHAGKDWDWPSSLASNFRLEELEPVIFIQSYWSTSEMLTLPIETTN
jgi:hypothetical protein